MPTITKNFTGVGPGHAVLGGHQWTLDYEVSGTFVGTVVLEKSSNGGQTWENLGTFSGAATSELPIEDRSQTPMQFRFRCTAYTSGTIETEIITTDPSVVVSSGAGNITDINGDTTASHTITVDTAGNDVAIATAGGTTTISVPTASAVNRGALSSADWSTFNSKLGAAITSLGGQTGATQTLTTGTAGTDFAISSATDTHTFNLPTASASNRGALSSADWSTFNAKAPTASPTFTGTVTMPDSSTWASGGIALGNQKYLRLATANNEIYSDSGYASNFVLMSFAANGGYSILEAKGVTNPDHVAVFADAYVGWNRTVRYYAGNNLLDFGRVPPANGDDVASFRYMYAGTSYLAPRGSATAAGFSFYNDVLAADDIDGNTGIYSSAADNLDFTTGGSNRGNIDSSGKWTLGTSGGSQIHRINGATQAAGTDAMTLGNGPAGTAGDPDVFLKININGTDYVIPAWTPT